MKQSPKVWTIGHSNRTITEFISLLKTVNIQIVIDVRSKPRSRFYWFNSTKLTEYLAEAGIVYEHQPSIGGFIKGDDYTEVLDSIATRAQNGKRLALMCSEGKPEQCHRDTELTPEFQRRNIKVEHLLYDRTL